MKPEDNAGRAAVASIKGFYSPEHSVLPDSIRVLSNADARKLDSVFVGTKEIEIEHRHLPDDPNNVVVTGVLQVKDEYRPFIVYLRFDPPGGRYETLDAVVHAP